MKVSQFTQLPLLSVCFLMFAMFAGPAQGQDGKSKTGAAILVSITGAVTFTKGKDREAVPKEEVAVGKAIYEGYNIDGTKGSKVILLFSNGSMVTLTDEFKFTIEQFKQKEFKGSPKTLQELEEEPSTSQTKLQLAQGTLNFNVKKLRTGSTFEIESPVGLAGIRGTVGQLQAIPNGAGGFNGGVNMSSGSISFTDPSGASVNVPGGQGTQVQTAQNGQQVGPTTIGDVPADVANEISATAESASALSSEVTVESLVDAVLQTDSQATQDATAAPSEGQGNESNNDDAGNEEGNKNDDGASNESAEASPEQVAAEVVAEVAKGATEAAVTVAVGLNQDGAVVADMVSGMTNAMAQESAAQAEAQGANPSEAVAAATDGAVDGAVTAATDMGAPADVVQSVGEAAQQGGSEAAQSMDNVSNDAASEVNVGDAITQAENAAAAESVDIAAATEALAQTAPNNIQDPFILDSDNDGLGDVMEEVLGSDPNNPDTDGDLLMDGYEYLLHGADPTLPDTDGDLISDSLEIHMGSDPLTVNAFGLDSDVDGIPDSYEAMLGTHPEDVDSDDDGWTDGFEVGVGSNPLVHDTFIPVTGFTVSPIGPGDPFPWLIREGLNPGPWWLRHLW